MREGDIEALHRRGVRVTPQRAYVWRELTEGGGHYTAEEIWERSRERLPGLELSTVYRALDALRGAGLVVESRLPEGPRIFEAGPGLHSHLYCVGCKEISHPESSVERRLSGMSELDFGDFEVHGLHLVAIGLCAGCAGRRDDGESQGEEG